MEDGKSYFTLPWFWYALKAQLAPVQLRILVPPADILASELSLPYEVARVVHGDLRLMLPLTAAIGYRVRTGLVRDYDVAYAVLLERVATPS